MKRMNKSPRRRTLRPVILLLVLATVVAIVCLAVLDQPHPNAHLEKVGTVHFETSCAPRVAPKFDRALAMLHSFEFSAAIDAFHGVLKEDPNCAIAYWGIALSQWDNPFAGHRPPEVLKDAGATIQKGIAIGAKTQRENDYLAAVAEFYKNADTVNEHTRTLNYEAAMERLTHKYPDDFEAQIFYALALAQDASPEDKTYARQKQSAAILESAIEKQPDHPGATHYLIHVYDVPSLAVHGLKAASHYASIAPSSPHALHMPSHIFTRVGDWQASIDANLASAQASREQYSPGELLHALDYLEYAYLQTAQDRSAHGVLDQMQTAGRYVGGWRSHVPESLFRSVIRRASPASAFALAAIPARYALEREAWSEASGLEVFTAPEAPYTDAITRFARALGFARSGDPASARREIAELEKLHAGLAAKNDVYWAKQVDIERLAASAWASHAEGKQDEALSLMRSAAEEEDGTEKNAITPGPLKPAREQLGELLLELNQPAPALKEFETTLVQEPNRFRAIYGAAHAAKLAGDTEKARMHYQHLLLICQKADSDRPELQEASPARLKTPRRSA
jgi:Tfp pilus assembly protein PilF